MSIKVHIRGGEGKGQEAKVTPRGELIVGSYDLAEPYFNAMSSINTAYSVIEPRANQRFFITSVIIDADRNVSNTTPATIVLYEADSANSTTATKTLLTLERIKNTSAILTALNFATTKGKFLNAKTDDATVNITVAGYYVPA